MRYRHPTRHRRGQWLRTRFTAATDGSGRRRHPGVVGGAAAAVQRGERRRGRRGCALRQRRMRRPRVATSGPVRAFAATPLPHIDAAIAEMSGAIDELGKVGVTMNTSILYLHPVGNRGRSPLVSEHRITWMVGAPFEDTIAAMQLITSGHLPRYPAVKIICSHLGGPRPVIPPSRRRRRRMGDDRHSATAQPGCASTLGLHRKPLPTVRQCDAPSTHSSGRWPTSTRRPIPATRTPYWSERHGSVRHSRLGRLALALGVAQAYPEPGGLADRFLDRPWFPT